MNELGAGIEHDAQLRQWARGDRTPSAQNCVFIERATNGQVTRQALRKDWQAIWPELIEPMQPSKREKVKAHG